MEIISILGCGWYGLAAGEAFAGLGYTVKGSTTSPERFEKLHAVHIQPYVVNITGNEAQYADDFFNCHTLIVSIPPKLRGGEHEEYLGKIKQLITIIKNHKIRYVIFISSTGVYPELNAEVDEDTIIEPNTHHSKTLIAAENILKNETGFSTTVIRFGGLIGPGRHPGRFFAGKSDIPNGQAPVNLIHLQDCVGITQRIVKQQAYGLTFNACSPHHPPKQEFYTMAAKHAGLPIPYFKDEVTDWKIVNNKYLPLILNYNFKVSNWADCFANSLF